MLLKRSPWGVNIRVPECVEIAALGGVMVLVLIVVQEDAQITVMEDVKIHVD